MVLVNLAKNANYWLEVRLICVGPNRDAIGARVTVRAGERPWVDEVRSGSATLQQRTSIAFRSGPEIEGGWH